jgi:hypothetical protein
MLLVQCIHSSPGDTEIPIYLTGADCVAHAATLARDGDARCSGGGGSGGVTIGLAVGRAIRERASGALPYMRLP